MKEKIRKRKFVNNGLLVLFTLCGILLISCITVYKLYGPNWSKELRKLFEKEEYATDCFYDIYQSDYSGSGLAYVGDRYDNFSAGIPISNSDFEYDTRLFSDNIFASTLVVEGDEIKEAINDFMNAYKSSVYYNYLVSKGELDPEEWQNLTQKVANAAPEQERAKISEYFRQIACYTGVIPQKYFEQFQLDSELSAYDAYTVEYVTAVPTTMLGGTHVQISEKDGKETLEKKNIGNMQAACIVYIKLGGVVTDKSSDYTIMFMVKENDVWGVREVIPAEYGLNRIIWMTGNKSEEDVIGGTIPDGYNIQKVMCLGTAADSWELLGGYEKKYNPGYGIHSYQIGASQYINALLETEW